MDLTQIASPDLATMIQGGSAAVLVWFFVRMLTVTIPAMDARADIREKMRDEKDYRYEQRLDSIQSAYLASVDRLHTDCEKSKAAQQDSFSDMLSHQRQNAREEAALVREVEARKLEKLAAEIAARRDRENGSRGGA